jgi:ABC-type polysaccharide/polyol phosphate transport system ATPase subunit
MGTTAAVIEARGLAKSFRIPSDRRETIREHVFNALRPRSFERLDVLRSVSLEVRQGETVGIMGRNGSGKSTLLKILCGIYRADAGTLRVTGPVTPILELGLGWNPELDGIDNILLIGTAMGLRLKEAKDAVDEILDFAGLDRFAGLPLKHYSSGMAARLAYSVAFRTVRGVLVLDEIFAVGDQGFRARCEERYLQLRERGHTIVMVSHDPRVVSTFCNRAILLDEGRIVVEGGGQDVVAEYGRLMGMGTVSVG